MKKKDESTTPLEGELPKRGSRKLVLHKETLRNLEAGELRQVVAGIVTNGACERSHPHRVCASVDGC